MLALTFANKEDYDKVQEDDTIDIETPVTQAQAPPAISQKLSNVTLVTILDNLGDEGRWTSILHKALEES